LLIVVCCLLLSASAVAIVVANATSTSASAINAACSAMPVLSLPLRQPSPSGQEAPAEDGGRDTIHHGQVLFGRERLKRSILVHILLNKEPYFVAGQSQQILAGTGILRNPQESS
jgi:hypothetical protein